MADVSVASNCEVGIPLSLLISIAMTAVSAALWWWLVHGPPPHPGYLLHSGVADIAISCAMAWNTIFIVLNFAFLAVAVAAFMYVAVQ